MNVINPKLFSLAPYQIAAFEKNGYIILPQWLSGEALAAMQQLAQLQFKKPSEPWELEAQLGYPGAPASAAHEGGYTTRRLLGAYRRDPMWQSYATNPSLKNCLQQLFKHPDIFLSQAHHNCLMTKSPRFSSDTGWHQDSRYWRFAKPELITAWLALGRETSSNGGLQVIPGSHRQTFLAEHFDKKAFFLANKP
nr:phytanoyl-CoA dioxygenase family protein [Cellvibrionaceae bacterium]